MFLNQSEKAFLLSNQALCVQVSFAAIRALKFPSVMHTRFYSRVEVSQIHDYSRVEVSQYNACFYYLSIEV